jgi:hypothetical protein
LILIFFPHFLLILFPLVIFTYILSC